ncbi:Cutinase gene palindrome-binding protein [Hypsizygus marmoreus]|uniref:Cutinase gene palindrome-binding protein n=1 Tax=Hypsizygus marmoreus TaxID=39966 RepID=A0A369JRV4_HYPMA|nr:Cutinase gene palindrome-binding protein [Hypsizygus marmoreus]
MSAAGAPQASSSIPKTFEFTKRKRWADLLVTEIADGINFILSASCTVLYCGPAVTELLGWKGADLIDCDLLGIINPDDQVTFRASFEESFQTNTDLLSYIRLKCNENFSSYSADTKDVLFEIKGHPHSHETEGKCFFAIAKPYPSRNTEMLNTYLELKTENEQLQRRLLDLRSRLPSQPAPVSSIATSSQIYATSPIQSQPISSTPGLPEQHSAEASGSYYPSSNKDLTGYDSLISNNFENGLYDDGVIYTPPVLVPSNVDDESEDGLKKKKVKKAHIGEQYVCITCGRTDSPEWRKGPLGPKTLCNACGLRWAKQTRKADDPSGEGGDKGGSTSPPT